MLDNTREKDCKRCVYCLKLMTNINRMYWRFILDTNGIDCLCDILRKYANILSAQPSANEKYEKNNFFKNTLEEQNELEVLALDTISVLCNLADQYEIKEKLNQTRGLLEILTKIICLSSNEDIQSRVSILIADVASIDHRNNSILATHGCLIRLLKLLKKSSEDLLINTINAIEVLCLDNVENQNFCANNGIFLSFMELLKLDSGENEIFI